MPVLRRCCLGCTKQKRCLFAPTQRTLYTFCRSNFVAHFDALPLVFYSSTMIYDGATTEPVNVRTHTLKLDRFFARCCRFGCVSFICAIIFLQFTDFDSKDLTIIFGVQFLWLEKRLALLFYGLTFCQHLDLVAFFLSKFFLADFTKNTKRV